MAIGLLAISRGLGASLSTLSALQRRDRFLAVANSTLQQLGAEAQQAPPLPLNRRHGLCDGVADCEWELTSESFNPPALGLSGDVLRLVTLSVHRRVGAPGRFALRVVWPAEWVAE